MLTIRILTALQNGVSYLKEERGAVAAEYAVLLTLIAVALIGILQLFTGAITAAIQAAINVLNPTA